MEIKRRKTRPLKIGPVTVGGDSPVTVQSMANTYTADVNATIAQIKRLEEVGCEIIRVAVPDEESALAISKIKKAINIPLIADIHFDWKLALKSLDSGADALRLNPGNIGSAVRIREVVAAASFKGAPIRIGVNAGSLEKDLLEKHGHPTAEAMAESAMRHIRILEDEGFGAIKVSLKASSVLKTIAAYRLLAGKVDYPFHVGITEAGTIFSGTIKSSVGLGILFSEGLGDTLRVSLTADPAEEVKAGWEILKSLGLRQRGVSVVSCPTCGRIKINCEKLALEVKARLSHIKEPVTVAVMGCVVNGPGEAMEADVGIAGGDGVALLYSGGKVLRKVREIDAADALVEEVERIVKTGRSSARGGGMSGSVL